jgi:precorrin-2/cobalt-factor-2 C20-methyltransferase
MTQPVLQTTNTLVGVGVGPGDPELVTAEAADLLATAEVVFVPVTDQAETGRAERAVLYYAEAWRVDPVVVAPAGCGRAPDTAAVQVAAWFAAHPSSTAVFATSGDPSVHPVFGRLAASVRVLLGGLDLRFVPGNRAVRGEAS